jgi:hypothetical protein
MTEFQQTNELIEKLHFGCIAIAVAGDEAPQEAIDYLQNCLDDLALTSEQRFKVERMKAKIIDEGLSAEYGAYTDI